MDTSEIKRGEFVYRDTLFVDLGPNKRHPRASPSDLKDLLLPKSGSATLKDQVAHWYEAQLIHYGLQRSKDKNTAKVRLTNAIASKSLSVPPPIQQMEADMKKEFATAARKAKNATNKSKEAKSADQGAVASKKRKADDSGAGTKTTVSVKVGDVTLEIGHLVEGGVGKGSKKQKKEPSEPKKSVSKPKPASKPVAKPPTKATPKSTSEASKKSAPVRASKPGTKATPSTSKSSSTTVKSPTKSTTGSAAPRTGSYARRGGPLASSVSTRPPPASPQNDGFAARSVDSDVDMDDDAPPPYDSIDFDDQYDDRPNERFVQISGSYDIESSDGYSGYFALRIDRAKQKLWGRFGIGHKTGIIRVDTISGLGDGRTVTFGWISEDDDDGGLRFGRGCEGTMQFDGEGRFEGHFHGLLDGEDIDFSGRMLHEDAPEAGEMAFHWDEFPRRAYGRD